MQSAVGPSPGLNGAQCPARTFRTMCYINLFSFQSPQSQAFCCSNRTYTNRLITSLRHTGLPVSSAGPYSWHKHKMITLYFRVDNNLSSQGYNFNASIKELRWKQHLIFDLESEGWSLNSGLISSASFLYSQFNGRSLGIWDSLAPSLS